MSTEKTSGYTLAVAGELRQLERAPTRAAARPGESSDLPVVQPGARQPDAGAWRKGVRSSRLWAITLFTVVIALLTFGLTDDLLTQVRLHHTQVHLTATRTALKETRALLASAERSLANVQATRSTDQATLEKLSGELAAAQQRLGQAKQGQALQNLSIATLDTCVNGVQQAIGDLQSGNSQGAISAIASVATPCESLQGSTAGGPVYPFDFADPDVIDVGGTYLGYATNAAGGNVQIIESSDLSHWKTVGDALPRLAAWASPDFTWAPAVLQLGSTFLLYYTVVPSGTSLDCISVGVSHAPQGPFVDSSTGPLVCQSSLGGSIDPAPFIAASGAPYLAWKSNGGSGQPDTIWAQALSPSGTAMASGSAAAMLLRPSQAWEGSVVEGPAMWVWHGGYFLFYAGNDWNSGSYALGVATCAGPLGPCKKPLGGPVYASQSNLAGPGGPSVFPDATGQPWIAFHAWLPQGVGYPNARLLFLRRLGFSGGMPQVEPPASG